MKVHIVGGDAVVAAMFISRGHSIVDWNVDKDLVVFTGGADVSPSYYEHPRHPFTHASEERDKRERAVFLSCKEKGIPMAGVCRGGQFLNVMSGGEMYQHVTEHTRSHDIVDARTGETIHVTSTHHQMMKPSDEGELIAFSHNGGTREYWGGETFLVEDSEKDIEVVYYEHTNALCFQPHPEYIGSRNNGMTVYFFKLIEELLTKKEVK